VDVFNHVFKQQHQELQITLFTMYKF